MNKNTLKRMTIFIKTKFKISDLESPSNFQVKEKIIQIGPGRTKYPLNFQVKEEEKIIQIGP